MPISIVRVKEWIAEWSTAEERREGSSITAKICTLANMVFGKDKMQTMGTKCIFLALKLEHVIIGKSLCQGVKLCSTKWYGVHYKWNQNFI